MYGCEDETYKDSNLHEQERNMKKLQCRVVSGDYFTSRLKGLLVTVVSMDHSCLSSGFQLTARIEDHVPADHILDQFGWKKGSELTMYSNDLDPVDVETIPETHRSTLVLRQAWAFTEARNDAWYRCEPKNKAKYLEAAGVEWTDCRVYNVVMRRR
jgi:hypothetical protein